MKYLHEYKFIICILFTAIFLFVFSTVVTSATINNLNSFTELKDENTVTEDEYEDIKVVGEDKKESTETSDENTNEQEDETKNDVKDNVQNTNQNTSTNSLSKAGIEDSPGMVIISLFVIASVYAYLKMKKYNNAE